MTDRDNCITLVNMFLDLDDIYGMCRGLQMLMNAQPSSSLRQRCKKTNKEQSVKISGKVEKGLSPQICAQQKQITKEVTEN